MLKKFLPILFLLVGIQANAAILNIDTNGILMGIDDVDVNGTLYNVDFVEGSCYTLFAPCINTNDDPFTFNLEGARAASRALKDIFELPENSYYDLNVETTFGCADAEFGCSMWTAYAMGADNMGRAYFTNGNEDWFGLFPNNVPSMFGNPMKADDTNFMEGTVYAIWEDASGACVENCNGDGGDTTAVPEPSILVLFAAGLFGIRFARRRKA
ncbi:MAG: PEP-CTERM sorting domain-containing protein [Gammaproteobacteria bacterium]|nr:PEP-CTERM sorting domain-containing protein [Gammaproteobacteria bacterium]